MSASHEAREPLRSRERHSLALPWDELRARLAALGRVPALELADALGVERRAAMRALAGRRCNTSAYVQLCLALGLDPVLGRDRIPLRVGPVLWWFFGSGLAIALHQRGLSYSQAAPLAGVTESTLSRVTNGEAVSAENFLALCVFLGRGPERFTGNTNCNPMKTLEAA